MVRSGKREAQDDQLTFRAWLVRQLQVVRWSSPDGEPIAETAKTLGVRVDVLEEAIAARALTNIARGKPRRALGKRALHRFDYALIRLTMPAVVREDWMRYCEALRVSPAIVLRSLIHQFLLTGNRPSTMTAAWHYRGAVHSLSRAVRSVSPNSPTRITRGAQQVLDEYADLWGVRPSAIVRGLVIDMLEGRTRALQIVSYSELWGDPARYKRPEPPAPLPPPSRKKKP